MTLSEWGPLSPETLSPLYRREESGWRAALGWDTAASWATVESARVSWGLPGLVCSAPDGSIRGWTFFMYRDGVAEMGGLVADCHDATAALLDGVLAQSAGRLSGFIYATAPSLAEACAARGIATDRYAYLSRGTNRVPYERPAAGSRPWRSHDGNDTAALLKEAYGEAGRLFARDNSEQEWRTYVENLAAYTGCGLLRPDLSRVVESNGRLAALALVTSLASDTAHLAQLAVHPGMRRGGIANTLIADTLKSAHASGFSRMSLLVSTDNTLACRLYRQWGFVESGTFLALRPGDR